MEPLDYLLFDTAYKIVDLYGTAVPVLELDPFVESGQLYEDSDIAIILVTQLVGDDDGNIFRARRILVHDLSGLTETELSNKDLANVKIVYDHYIREDSLRHTETFVRGDWLLRLRDLRESFA